MTTKRKRPTTADKTDLFSILTLNIDVENKTPEQFKKIMQRVLKKRDVVDAIENYVNKKLKPFGLTVSRFDLDHHEINEA